MSDFSIDQVILFTQFGCDLFERLVGRNSLTWMIRGHHARIPSVDLRFVDGHLDHIRVDAPGDHVSQLTLGLRLGPVTHFAHWIALCSCTRRDIGPEKFAFKGTKSGRRIAPC